MQHEMTVEKVFEIIGKDIPQNLIDKKYKKISRINLSETIFDPNIANIHENSVFICDAEYRNTKKYASNAYKNGALIVISDQNIYDENNQLVPTIIVKNTMEITVKLMNYIMSFNNAKNVCVTGTVGKTTTKQFLYNVIAEQFNVSTNKANANDRIHIPYFIQELEAKHEVYLQEVAGAFPKMVEYSAQMIHPDIVIVTNIGDYHRDLYQTKENIMYDKTALIRYMNDDGVAILNYDDALLRTFESDKKIQYYSVLDESADFYGYNIVSNKNGQLELDIKYKDTNIHVVANILGKHNAYNIIACYAVAKALGINDEQFKKGILNYKSEGSRQNFIKVGNYNLLVDCFNASNQSVLVGIQTIQEMEVKGKKIAILGRHEHYGEDGEMIYRKLGQDLADFDIDLYILQSNELIPLKEELEKVNKKVLLCEKKEELTDLMRENIDHNDLVFIKAGLYQFYFKNIDQIFGTDFYWNFPTARSHKATKYKGNPFNYAVMENTVVIDYYNNRSEKRAVISNEINGSPVLYINRNSFKNSEIENVTIGENVVGIGKFAFRNTKIKKIIIPESVRYISQGAFEDCENLEVIIIKEGTIHIEKNAFKNCKKIKKVYLPNSIRFISQFTFSNVPNNVKFITENKYVNRRMKKIKEYMKDTPVTFKSKCKSLIRRLLKSK